MENFPILSLEYKQLLLFCKVHHESQKNYQWKKVDVSMLQETLEVMLICRRSPMSEAYFLSASLIELLQCIGVTSRVSLGTLTVFVFHWIFFNSHDRLRQKGETACSLYCPWCVLCIESFELTRPYSCNILFLWSSPSFPKKVQLQVAANITS